MSFQVGDKLVVKDPNHSRNDIFEVGMIGTYGGVYDIRWRLLRIDLFRHATPEEIEAGHRIDHCVEATKKVELFGNSEGLEVLEMIDVSPNCEVIEQ